MAATRTKTTKTKATEPSTPTVHVWERVDGGSVCATCGVRIGWIHAPGRRRGQLALVPAYVYGGEAGWLIGAPPALCSGPTRRS